MNEAFYELSEEKQQAIYNASMEVFGDYEYNRASTDLIASKAGVSKGLLFYYFHNKKALYLHTFEYVSKIVEDAISDTHLSEITDFFELISYATEKKVKILIENPFIMRFSIRCFYSQKEDVSSEIQTEISNEKGRKYDAYFKNLELGKFKEEIDPPRPGAGTEPPWRPGRFWDYRGPRTRAEAAARRRQRRRRCAGWRPRCPGPGPPPAPDTGCR